MSDGLKLIVEKPASNEDFEYVLEEKIRISLPLFSSKVLT